MLFKTSSGACLSAHEDQVFAVSPCRYTVPQPKSRKTWFIERISKDAYVIQNSRSNHFLRSEATAPMGSLGLSRLADGNALFVFTRNRIIHKSSGLCLELKNSKIVLEFCTSLDGQLFYFVDSHIEFKGNLIGSKLIDNQGNNHLLKKRISQGMFGVVYRTDSNLAVKIFFHNDRHMSYGNVDREISILKKLNQYKGSGVFHDPEMELDRAFIVMKWIDGKKLSGSSLDKLENEGINPEKFIDSINESRRKQIHEDGIIHGDLDIGNMLFQINSTHVAATIIDYGNGKYVCDLTPGEKKHFIQEDSNRLSKAINGSNFLRDYLPRLDLFEYGHDMYVQFLLKYLLFRTHSENLDHIFDDWVRNRM